MQKWRSHYVFMEEAGSEASSGGTGRITPVPTQTNEAGTQTDGGGNNQTTILANGANEPQSGTTDYIPEKYQVKKDDGTLDIDASSRKLAEAYSAAEKRIGSGDVRPKTADEYAVQVPDAFKESWKPEEDKGYQEFKAKAFEAGLTQKQMDLVMGQYFEIAPKLVAGAALTDAQQATEELQKTWSTEADFKRNVTNAYQATSVLASKAGLSVDEIMQSPLGNSPQFLRLMAVLGPELKEDSNPTGDGSILSGDEIESLMSSEAYTNSAHKDHAKVSAKVQAYFNKKYGTEAAA